MTTRKFRVKTGLTIGDIAAVASTNAITGVSSITLDNTTAPAANGTLSNKKYVDDQIAAISTTAITSGTTNATVSGTTLTVTCEGNEEMTVTDDGVRISGNLTVDGTTSTINTTNTSIEDPIMELSRNNSGPSDIDAGILINRGASNNAAIYWNEGDDVFKAVTTTSAGNATEITDTAFADFQVKDLTAASLALTTDLSVANGGTGASTLTDGGVLLGSGTGAITAMAVLSDGEMIVGDGTTDPVAESGATLRTSIGVGTGDSPQFTGIELGHATDTTITKASSGDLNIEGNIIYRAGGTDVPVADGGTGASTLTDGGVLLGSGTGAITAMAVLSDGEMIVGDGTTDPVAESGATLRTSIGVGTGDTPTFNGMAAGAAKITGLGAPVSDTDASTKKYVDDSVAAVSTTAITSGTTNVTVAATKATVTASGTVAATFDNATTRIHGNLTVDGTTTTINTTNTSIEDPILELSRNNSGPSDIDAGILINRGASNNAAIYWNEGDDVFKAVLTTSESDATAITDTSTATIVANITGDTSGSSGSCTGNAATATALASARNIGGVSFDGTGNINLPGVNASGSQDTSGNAATATALASARNIGGVSFDGTANINLPGVNTAGSQNTSGTAAIGTSVTVVANNTANETVYLAFVDGSTGTQGIETDTGLSYNPSTNVLSTTASSAQYADVAERFEADAPMAEGAVVEIGGTDEITEATAELSENVFGVISTRPAYAMNAGAGNSESHPFVAMTGRTPVRVTGLVEKGQRLVSSTVKGTARAVATGETITPFHVIGRALESKDDAGIGLVNCAVRTNN